MGGGGLIYLCVRVPTTGIMIVLWFLRAVGWYPDGRRTRTVVRKSKEKLARIDIEPLENKLPFTSSGGVSNPDGRPRACTTLVGGGRGNSEEEDALESELSSRFELTEKKGERERSKGSTIDHRVHTVVIPVDLVVECEDCDTVVEAIVKAEDSAWL
ncbi:hypothetical protein WN48_02885 [Eufriesea mexicana]|uniref:Uncharacterized protein n=1 Tax=Eufriesea mexicana TaxID=516756 RepID=A0A310SFR2_9HYME|nr:hypothetical protein WN48_02885 [Eufriesea mexicana]